jgi:tRNA pseudouridine55 synthase
LIANPQVGDSSSKAAKSQRPTSKKAKRSLHGVLLLDKPIGLSSNDALQKVKWLLQAEKAGHTGTLDPLATGVLPICFGAATKFSQLHLDADKSYEAVAVLGVKTSTGDSEGEIVQRRAVNVSALQLEEVVKKFTGPLQQIPPMYSALKKDGRALYEYAREGVEVDRAPRAIVIHSLSITDLGEIADQTTNEVELDKVDGLGVGKLRKILIRVRCSKGTYIRTLAEDIGEALGCGSSLTALRRTATGDFGESECYTLDQLNHMQPSEIISRIMPPDVLLADHLVVELDESEAGKFLSGFRRRGEWPNCEKVVVYGTNPRALLGTAHVVGGELISQRLLNVNEIKTILDQTLEKKNDTSN